MTIGSVMVVLDWYSMWLFGYGHGWASQWFDIGPLCIYWPEKVER